MRSQYNHEDSDDYDVDIPRHRGQGFGGRDGRIILLGDGSEVLTDSTDDAEMFDHSMDDDKDVENQIKRGTSGASDDDSTRSEREGTPGPSSIEEQHEKHEGVSHGPGTTIKGVADTPDSRS